LFCIGKPEARSVLDRHLLTDRYCASWGIRYVAHWKMAEPQRRTFIEQYHLKNRSQDLAVELAAKPLADNKEGASIEFALTLKSVSDKTYRVQERTVFSGLMLYFMDERGRFAPSHESVKYYFTPTNWLELGPGATHKYTIPVQIRRVADLKAKYSGLSSDAELFATTKDVVFDIARKGRFRVYAMVEAQPPTKTQLEKLDFDNLWTGRAVSKPVEVDISWTPPVRPAGNPIEIEIGVPAAAHSG
jgi:hypothetical protein